MASITTQTWGTKSTCPRITLSITENNKNGSYIEYNWQLTYYASAGGAQTSVNKKYTAVIDGETVANSTYNINGKTGTHVIASGKKKIYRTSSVKTVSYSCSMEFNLYWSGTFGGKKTANGSFDMQPKTGYTVTYNANGGSGAPSSQTVWNGTFNVSTTIPFKSGSTFSHWKDADGNAYYHGATYSISSDLDLTAVWNDNSSNCTVTYNANGGSGAPNAQTVSAGATVTISSIKPTRNGYTFAGWSTESGDSNYVVYQSGSTFTVYKSVTLYAVWNSSNTVPKISNYMIERCDAQGNPSDDGTCALVKFNWSTYYQCRSVEIQYREKDTEYFTTHNVYGQSGYSGTVSELIDGSFLASSIYEFQVIVTDTSNISSTSQLKQLGASSYSIDILNGGSGLAFGKHATMQEIIESVWGFIAPFFDGKWKSNGSLHELSMKDGNVQHRAMTGQQSTEWKELAYKKDVVFTKGDVATFAFYGAGFVTSDKCDICFTVPVKPMVGVNNVMAQSDSGFIIRQNGRYCFNSNGGNPTTYVYPSRYSTKIEGHTVRITATFNRDANVINNDSIGIVWSGKLIFQ